MRIMTESADLTRAVTVANRAGMHARAAVELAKLARRFDARVVVAMSLHKVEATDVLQLMSLGAQRGEHLSLEASGNEALAALDAIEQLFLRKFDED